jgi:hypothetical protein
VSAPSGAGSLEAPPPSRLSNRQLAAAVFRAWGIMWAVYALLTLVGLAHALLGKPYGDDPALSRFAVSSQAISFACEVLLFVFLMRRAEWLASVVFPVEAELGAGLGATELRAVLFSAIGLYFFIAGARGSVGFLYRLVVNWRRAPTSPPRELAIEPERLVSDVTEMVLGAAVFFWNRGGPLAVIRSAYDRTLGLRETPEPPP